MKDRKRAGQRTTAARARQTPASVVRTSGQAAEASEQPKGRRTAGDYGRLAAVCLAIAVVVSLIAALVMPPATPLPEPDSLQPLAAALVPEPTIELPTAPVEVSTEALRAELLQLGEDLQAEFPRVPEALHVVGLLYADLQKTPEAKAIFQECIQLAPKQPGPYVGLARAAMELGEDETAVEALRQALSAGGSSPQIYDELSAALAKLGRLEEASAASQEGVKAFPQSAESWLQLGQVQIQLGQFAEAETSLQQALSAGLASESVYFSLATAAARQGKQEEAARHREQFSKLKAARDAKQAEFQGRYDHALRSIAVASLARAGAVYDELGDTATAERLLLRSAALDPHSSAVHTELVAFYRRQGRIADARLVQRRLVEIEPALVPHHVNLGSLSAELGDYEQAETSLKRVVELQPELAIGYASLAHLYLRTGRLKSARSFAETALGQQSGGPDEAVQILMVLAAACDALGDKAAAEAAISQARKIAPDDPRVQQAALEPARAK